MKTREILKGMLVIGAIVMLGAACNKADDGPTLDFEITVPDEWGYYVLSSDNIVYYASSPLENQQDSITEDVLITKDALTGQNLTSFCQAVISSLDDDTSFHAVYFSPVDTMINGEPSRKLIHLQTIVAVRAQTQDTVFLPAKKVSYFFVKNEYGYVVTMSALVVTYPTYKPIFDTIISSFRFKAE
jgi:hypothetical protein